MFHCWQNHKLDFSPLPSHSHSHALARFLFLFALQKVAWFMTQTGLGHRTLDRTGGCRITFIYCTLMHFKVFLASLGLSGNCKRLIVDLTIRKALFITYKKNLFRDKIIGWRRILLWNHICSPFYHSSVCLFNISKFTIFKRNTTFVIAWFINVKNIPETISFKTDIQSWDY